MKEQVNAMIRWIVLILIVQVATVLLSVSSYLRLNDRSNFMESNNARLEGYEQRLMILEKVLVMSTDHRFRTTDFDAFLEANPQLNDHRNAETE